MFPIAFFRQAPADKSPARTACKTETVGWCNLSGGASVEILRANTATASWQGLVGHTNMKKLALPWRLNWPVPAVEPPLSLHSSPLPSFSTWLATFRQRVFIEPLIFNGACTDEPHHSNDFIARGQSEVERQEERGRERKEEGTGTGSKESSHDPMRMLASRTE